MSIVKEEGLEIVRDTEMFLVDRMVLRQSAVEQAMKTSLHVHKSDVSGMNYTFGRIGRETQPAFVQLFAINFGCPMEMFIEKHIPAVSSVTSES
jgi:hypothetical protein